MFERIREFLKNFFQSRLVVLFAVMLLLCVILLERLFSLQIVHGEEYQENYTLKIKKEKVLPSTRGNIYDRNGELLAYNELAYSVTIEDNGTYDSLKEKNKAINDELATILSVLDKNGDKIENNFNIALNEDGSYSFTVEGKSLLRFLADVYGRTRTDDLKYNKKLGYNEAEASADQVIAYLCREKGFDLSEDVYARTDLYRILVIRYAMSQNSFQKYISTTIATDVSEKTVAYVSENAASLQGMEISEDTIRRYVDSEYFAHIIGYTGKISDEEYENLSKESDNYTLTDVVGKSGIEQVMDLQLQGQKGYETVYVDNLGKVVETTERVEPLAGNDVYLSINKDWQEAIYDLLEQEIAGIVYSKIINAKEYLASNNSTAADIKIPIYDVYFALINNNVINTEHFTKADASETEQAVYSRFLTRQEQVLEKVKTELTAQKPVAFENLDEETQAYISYIVTMLSSNGILMSDKIDTGDEIYTAWKNDTISLKEYLSHAIDSNWIDITGFSVDEKYSDSSEIYDFLVQYILEELKTDQGFSKKIYKSMIQSDLISGTQLCLILYDQGVLPYDEAKVTALSKGQINSFDFLREKIHNLEITPAQLALDPCTGSCVITDVNTGELLACVTYPGFDNNRLANTVDAEYYAKLQADLSLPLYDYATQQRTAPGSTFKMVTATAGLTEGVLSSPSEQILDEGQFMKVSPSPKCWIYPSTHGLINVSEAIRDSCNYFFYEVGYRLSCNGETYNADKGISAITKYATMYGLGDTTGIEIPENEPQIATEYPITAAIGQSNHNYTTTELARYVTAVANSGTVYNYTLLNKVTDSNGNLLTEYQPTVKNNVDVASSTWDAIHSGMRMVVESHSEFDGFPIAVAGKTGTAQQVATRPNHALFVGYAPYEAPQISIATRIAYGYTSSNAVDVSRKVLSYCFGVEDEAALLNGQATNVADNANGFAD
ncbi:MAG: penicillin-binding transpeptidase domain-containing protein [Lachnospiraceae bacterium]|uniref:penicillin-binding transpeptidase domain-containing protein n=1 Tax=Roseburia hominis TaxID=301301 RepID=UPI001F3CB000|nr:penicillin-binding transpeptidase domain-containing protein [Lachnospiraceae bacterium]